MYNIVKSNLIAEKLKQVTSDDIKEVLEYYVHDFVLYYCGSSEENEDTKVRMFRVVQNYIATLGAC